MDVIIRPDSTTAAKLTAKIIANQIIKKPTSVIGLATGGTMESVYKELAQMHRDEGLDFSQVSTFNLDEYVGLAPEDVDSYRYYMNLHLFDQININKDNTYLPNGAAADLEQECLNYENKIKELGGIDLQLLGVGLSGHVGFNEPLSSFESLTRAVVLTPVTMAQNGPLFPNPADMPKRAITMGVRTILNSKSCLLLATGKHKADILAKSIEGPMTAMISATALQMHQNCNVIVDEDAAAKLTQQEFCKQVFNIDPAWAIYK
ncbi:MAG: glucosamine-6-phosphate deaminase [Kiritimatiellae bacterium]|nr:glucosamine-6-phosphate deaminase [Kiritimatiellia bacterium]